MKKIKKYEDFLSEEIDIMNPIKKGISALGRGISKVSNKVMTTGEQYGEEDQAKVATNQTTKSKEDIKELDTDNTYGVTKTGRIAKGQNPFIDSKSGKITALDQILGEKELQQVIDLWKNKDEKGAAAILQNFATRERNQQFNLAFAMMMSALCIGAGACLKVNFSSNQVTDATDLIEHHTSQLGFIAAKAKQLGLTDDVNTFISGKISKDNWLKVIDAIAQEKGVSRDEFLKKFFTLASGNNTDLVNKNLSLINKMILDPKVKIAADMFRKTGKYGNTSGILGGGDFGITGDGDEISKYLGLVTKIPGESKEVLSSVPVSAYTDVGSNPGGPFPKKEKKKKVQETPTKESFVVKSYLDFIK